MKLDPTVNLAFILCLCLAVVGLIARFVGMQKDVEDLQEYRKMHEARMHEMEKLHRDLANIVTILSTKAELSHWGRHEARRRAGEEDD